VRLDVSNRDSSTSTRAAMAPVVGGKRRELCARSRLVRLALLVSIFSPLALADDTSTTTTATASFAPGPLDFAVFATGTGCGAIKLSGSTSIDSYDSSAGTYAQTKQLNQGIVGVDGNIDLTGNATIYGPVFALNTTVGQCQNGIPGITLSGRAAAIGGYMRLSAPPTFVSVPIVPPGTTDVRITENMALAPGNYRNITVSGHTTLTLSPGTYNINSISITGQSVVTFSPPGRVIINVAGNNAAQPIQFSGGEIDNPTGIPLNFQLIYAGTSSVALSGGSNSHAILYAPSAPVSITGGSDWFGAMVVGTLDDSGGVDIHYDRSLAVAPAIAALVSPAPNAASWNNSNVTVSFTCSDPVFGIASCSPPVQITTEGANQLVTGTAVNRAGFSATTTVTINLDKTPPVITRTVMPPPNAAGWNSSNVTVVFTCIDALSGIASCPLPVVVSADGANQVVTGTAVDVAGNTAVAMATINLDKTPPTITATITPAPNASGWNNSNVTVTFTCTDALSGVAMCPAPVQVTTEGARQVVSGTAVDKAGNTATASATVNLDKTPPTVSITSPVSGAVVPLPSVTVTGNVSDLLSGVASVTCQGSAATISGSSFTCVVPVVAGPNTITVQATDAAGNSQQAIVTVQGGVPVILSVTPNSGQQGQNNLSVNITGQFTHWVQGTTSASFGAGVAVVSLTVNSPTSASAVLEIDVVAAVGARTVTLATGGEVVALGNAFAVSATPYVCTSPPSGLIGWWPGDGNANDVSGNHHDGTLEGGVTFVPGVVAQAFSFDGLTGLVNIPESADLDIRSAITIDAWIKPTHFQTPVPGTYAVIAGKPFGYQLTVLPDGRVRFGYPSGAGGQVNISLDSITAVSMTNFTFVTATYDASTGMIALYVNGALDNTALTSGLIDSVTKPFQIGGFSDPALTPGYGAFTGVIDEVQLLNRALSAADIQAIFTAGTAGECKTPVILSTSPNAAIQGQSNLPVTINGRFTNFVQSASQVSFGGGITVEAVTVANATSLTANISIAPDATVGPRTVTVTTSTEVATLAGGFAVTAALNQPPIVSAGPNQTITLQSAPVTITEYPTPSASLSGSITIGPDGNQWFPEPGANKIGRINPTTGAITEFPVPTDSGSQFQDIAAGPDGNLWFTDYFGQKIWKMTTAGVTTGFVVGGYPWGIAPGPDGNLWFTQRFGNNIARITAGGVITEFPIPTANSQPLEIITGPDGNLWFAEGAGHKVGRITPAGVVTEFPISTVGSSVSDPYGITPGPDGNLWFTEGVGNKIGRITPAGVITEFPIPSSSNACGTPSPSTCPAAITAGPDGNLWFTEQYGNNIGNITPAGVITEFPVPTILSRPFGIVAGPDGNLWFTEILANNIGKVNFGVFPRPTTTTLTGSVTDDGLPFGATLSTTWSETSGPSPVSFGTPTATFPDVAGQANPVTTSATFTTPGTYVLSLTGNDSQLSASANVTITVNPPQVGTILSVSPNTGQQGQQNLSVNVTSQFTHFVQGTTTASFGTGITVASLTVNSATTATAVLNIDPAATAGPRRVTLTTNSEMATLGNAFTVQMTTGTPVILMVNPNQAPQCSVNLEFNTDGVLPSASDGFQYVTGGNPGEPTFGASEATVFSVSNGLLHVNTAALGPNMGFAYYTRNGLFDSTKDLMIEMRLALYSDSAREFSISSLSQDLTWAGLVFENGQMIVLSDPPPSPQFPVADTGFHTYRISYTAATRQYELFVDGVQMGGAQTFTYIGATPNRGLAFGDTSGHLGFNVRADIDYIHFQNCGQTPVTITGQFTHFVQGTTAASFGAGINVTSLTVNSPTGAKATLSIDPAAAQGPRTVTLTTGSEVSSLVNGFTVSPLTSPSITTSPNFGVPGQQNLSVAITGQNTHFAQGMTQVSFVGAAIAVATVTVANATSLIVQISIDPSARTGTYTVALTTGTETVSLDDGFTVLATGTPTLLSVNPNTGQQGQQNLSVTITGQLTHFVQGTTIASFGSNVTVASLTVNSPTTATAVLNIDPAAAGGARDVTLTTGVELVTLVNGFTVNPPICIVPPSGLVGWWPGDGNSNDIVGGDNGVPFGGLIFAPGMVGQAFSLNGVDGATAPNSSAIDITADLTIEAWIKPASSSRGYIVVKGNGNDYVNAYSIRYGAADDQRLLLQVADGTTGTSGSYFETVAGVVPVGVFSHVAATIQGTTATVYVNGVPVAGQYFSGQGLQFPQSALTANRFSDHGALTIGNGNTSPIPFTGLIDEVSVYNRALSASEIQAIFNAGSAGKCKSQAGGPALNSVVPNTGQQGQQNLPVTVTGQLTHFVQGTTVASFGAGVTVVSLTVSSATTATAVLSIDPAAAIGAHSVTLTTGSEVATLTNGFTVTGPTAIITAVNPNSGQQGQVLSVAITGAFTHFAQGATTVSFGSADITVNSVTVASPTNLTVNLSLAINALPGVRTVTVATTGAEVVSLAGGFTVQVACLSGKEPGVRVAGAAGGEFLPLPNGTLRLYTGLYPANPLISFISSDGINWTQEVGMRQPPPPPLIGATKLMHLPNGTYRMYYSLNPDGPYQIYSAVSNDGLTFVQESGVRVAAGGPFGCFNVGSGDVVRFPNGLLRMYYSCGPNLGYSGGNILSSTSTDGLNWTLETGIRLVAGGNSTGLDQYAFDPKLESLPDGTYRMYYSGIALPTGSAVSSNDRIFSAVSADGLSWADEPGIRLDHGTAGSSDSRVAAGARFVGLPDGTFRLYYAGYDDQGFTTILSAHWCSIGANNPPTVTAGPNQVVILPNTAALAGAASDDGLPAGGTLTFLWSMVSGPGTVSFTNSNALTATASFSQPGSYVLRLTASDTQLSTSSDVTIIVTASGGPAITSVSPNVGLQGQTNLTVAIVGQGTSFAQGTTAVDFGAGMTVGTVSVSDSTHLTAQISINPAATVGVRTVNVTTGSQTASLTNGFAVAPGTPAILSLLPPRGQQGQQNLSIGITGQLTHFSQGATVVSLGAGVTVSSVMVADATHLTAQVSINLTAPTGTTTVTVTTGSEIASLVNGFTVQPIPPVILSVTPNGAAPGQSNLSVAITGQFTHFVQGITTADFGPGITVGTLTATSPTTATAILSISPTAAAGSRVVTLTTNTEVATLDGGFTVQGVGCALLPPGIVGWWPAGGNANDIISSNNGNLVGGVTFAPGMVGQAFSFNGAGYVDVSGAPNLDLTGPLTLDAWIKLNSLGQNQYIFIRDSQTGAGALTNYQLHIDPDNSVEFDLGDGTNIYTLFSNTQLSAGTWYHIAAVYDGANEVLYINGVQDAISSIGAKTLITTPTKPLIIGALSNGGYPFVGLIDEVNIFNRGLQPSEVQAIFAAGGAGECQNPALSSVSPNAGQQGQQSLSVGITGQFTNFVQGTTTANFGAGITVVSLIIANATTATAIINIDSAAVPGARDVTLTTGAQIATLASGFSVTATVSVPTITSISPNAGPQGEGGPVGIVGMNTHFAQGTTQVSFGPGITVSNITVTCPTCLTARLQISPTAVPGPVTVTVTTGSEVASLANGFTIQPGTPIIASFGPTSAQQGQTFTLTVNGQFTHFTQGTTQVSLGAGATVSNISVSSATSLTAQIAIDPAATVGTRTLTVTTGTEVVSVANVFNVLAATPIIFSLNPGGGQQGQQNLSVAITGLATHFVQGTSQASFGAGVTVVSLTVTSATGATAVLNIDPAAAVGARTMTVTTGAEVASFANGFTIIAGTPAITTVNPNAGQQGQQNLSVNITSQFTHFVQGTTTANFGAGIAVATLTINSPTSATAVININSTAPVSSRDVILTTGSEIATLLSGFNVTSSTPAVTQVSPNTGPQGQQNLQITITGQSTHFVQGTTTANFGAGITVASVTVSSATMATVVLNIDPAATPGPRNVTFTTGSEVAALSNGFTITNGTPVITQISPNSSPQGIQNLSVQITGQFTHFAQGTTQVSFGTGGVTVNSVSVTNAGSLAANISIALNQTAGGLTVTVTTGAEIVSLQSGFLVQPAVNQPPVITIAPNWNDTLPNLLTITYGVADDGLPVGGALTVSWQTVSGPGNVGFQNQTLTCISCPPPGIPGPVNTAGSISVSFDQPGTYILQIGATDTQLTTTQNVTVTVSGTVGQPPTVSITSPADGTEVTTAVNVIGSVGSSSLSNWVLEYQPPNDSSFHTLATGTTPVTNGTLGTFDPTLLVNGIAYIRLTATDASNQSTTTGPISLVLTRNQKVGNFTVSFNDLTVPVAGLPIQVVRTYDSRNRFTSGIDFSYGWTLDINAARLAESVALGDQWTETSTGGVFPDYCVQPVKAHVVTLTLQDGTTYQFAPTLNPSNCQSLVPIQEQQVTITFSPMGATPPNAVLALVGNNQPYVVGSVPGPVTLTDADLITTFDPDQYLLTLPDGRTLQISMQSGLQKMTDLNGNTLTVTPSGITSSTGKSVTFTRNAARLITQITDPAGHSINYSYDPLTGNLTSVTDQSGNTTTFTYDPNHFLLTIVDPRGIQPIRNVYDNSGRLIQHIDAFGNVINYTNNLSANQEVVTDRLGNVTVNNYDADGNIVQVTDALGGVTNRTYDARDNLLTEKNALHETRTYTYDANNNRLTETDPLGNTTSYTYNARNQVLTITDALGHVTTNTYDANGNLLSTKDAAANTTTYVYNAQGLRTSMTDPLGGVSGYQYDGSGKLTQQTDPLGHVTTYTYDANGNKLTETKTRTGTSGLETLVTSYQYDASNRLINTTYADGSTTQIQYNAIGKQGVTIDQLGRRTSYQYDLMGRLTQTTYPDNTNEASTYDAEGDRITNTDRGGRITGYLYDPLKRLTRTTYADTATASTAYDAIGEVTGVTDPRGNVTQYQYDDAGRRVKVIDALTHSISFTYDQAGNQLSMTDANGNTTQYQYDALNRRIKTIYPDSTSDSVAYDALGRTISKTDQAGLITQFQYDSDGRLTQVTDAVHQLTGYAYDEIGERISQTDANNHTTSFAYDKLGRRTKRTLPLGMSETMTYDAAGNLASKLDFNSKTTSYAYDQNNRLTTKTPDPSFSAPLITFTYTATGQRQNMVDASGTTNYSYDVRDRLLSKATPQGTLTYTYDLAGNLTSIRSSNTNGTTVNYAFDVLNRLSIVTDNRLTSGTTNYSYDPAGNLAGYLYPNSVQHAYTYNALNRLTNLALAAGASSLATYAYTLGPAGNRTAVSELGGRQVNYTYDSLYRLTNEMIAGGTVNGSIGYTYDAVGNRLSRTSSVTPVLAATYTYDANDRLTSDTYDADGNTTASGANTYAYDFENHLTGENTGAVTITYDGDGNRVSKTASGVTTKYLVDDRNLTGYAQVLEEVSGGTVQRVYTYGLNRISQSQASGTSFYGYDGHGNVRLLTDTTGAVTDRYDYDAFGNILSQTGSTPNAYLYSGEQSDPNLGFYYLRARYLSQSTGRFWTMDTVEGEPDAPISLHKYTYANVDPVDNVDPGGEQADTLEAVEAEVIEVDILSQVIGPSVLALPGVLRKIVEEETGGVYTIWRGTTYNDATKTTVPLGTLSGTWRFNNQLSTFENPPFTMMNPNPYGVGFNIQVTGKKFMGQIVPLFDITLAAQGFTAEYTGGGHWGIDGPPSFTKGQKQRAISSYVLQNPILPVAQIPLAPIP
jgi:RHS repeat-associated protein